MLDTIAYTIYFDTAISAKCSFKIQTRIVACFSDIGSCNCDHSNKRWITNCRVWLTSAENSIDYNRIRGQIPGMGDMFHELRGLRVHRRQPSEHENQNDLDASQCWGWLSEFPHETQLKVRLSTVALAKRSCIPWIVRLENPWRAASWTLESDSSRPFKMLGMAVRISSRNSAENTIEYSSISEKVMLTMDCEVWESVESTPLNMRIRIL